jgi:hypothetical protein
MKRRCVYALRLNVAGGLDIQIVFRKLLLHVTYNKKNGVLEYIGIKRIKDYYDCQWQKCFNRYWLYDYFPKRHSISCLLLVVKQYTLDIDVTSHAVYGMFLMTKYHVFRCN